MAMIIEFPSQTACCYYGRMKDREEYDNMYDIERRHYYHGKKV